MEINANYKVLLNGKARMYFFNKLDADEYVELMKEKYQDDDWKVEDIA